MHSCIPNSLFSGIFSILYTLPALTIIICYLYEHKHMSDWTQKWQEAICREPFFQDKWQTPCRFPDARVPNTPDPKFNVFLIKYFSIAMIGIISGFWVWCGKTLTTWKSFFQRLSGHQHKNGNSAYVWSLDFKRIHSSLAAITPLHGPRTHLLRDGLPLKKALKKKRKKLYSEWITYEDRCQFQCSISDVKYRETYLKLALRLPVLFRTMPVDATPSFDLGHVYSSCYQCLYVCIHMCCTYSSFMSISVKSLH